MTNPYTSPPVPQTSRPAPRWARKRYVLPALGLALFVGVGIGGADKDSPADAKPVAASPRATVTATQTPPAQPAPTVTRTLTVEVTRTVTAQPASDDTPADGNGSIYYANCAAARATGDAPLHAGDPGYGAHLDRDGDGVACE
ncbi:excalibur calcium-binding domain-containing protein [Streptomyces cinerochromogenes]|uniref:excalibur calcium-binding domain-containing protein n=1 Tax=Streptomyces cinerochromogenes TaxID=66422 RepID=UPI00369F92A5